MGVPIDGGANYPRTPGTQPRVGFSLTFNDLSLYINIEHLNGDGEIIVVLHRNYMTLKKITMNAAYLLSCCCICCSSSWGSCC